MHTSCECMYKCLYVCKYTWLHSCMYVCPRLCEGPRLTLAFFLRYHPKCTLQIEAGSQSVLASLLQPSPSPPPAYWNYKCHLAFFNMSSGWGESKSQSWRCDEYSPTEPSQLPSDWISLPPPPKKVYTGENKTEKIYKYYFNEIVPLQGSCLTRWLEIDSGFSGHSSVSRMGF